MRLGSRARIATVALVALAATGCVSISRVSVDTTGGNANSFSQGSPASADGRYVAFASTASDLVPGDGNAFSDIFLRDRQTNTTTRVSVDTGGRDANGDSIRPSISADGRFVAFDSFATDLTAGDGTAGPNGGDVFVRDLQTNTTKRVSVDTAGGDSNGTSGSASISGDGRYVAFESEASDLVAGDGTGGPALTDIFVRDRQTNTTTRVSVDTAGGDPNGPSFLFLSPTISDDGRYVAFSSNATDLVPADGNSDTDVFVRDLQTHTTTRVSVDRTGGDAETASDSARISASGRYVAFESKARDLVPGDGNCTATPEGLVCRFDVYVRDLQTGVTTRVSVDTGGDDPNADSQHGAVSADGRYVVFESRASDLVSNDTNGLIDIFLWDRNTGTIQRMNTNANGAQAVGGQSIWPWITPDGGHLTFTSGATNLVSNDGNGFDDVFVRNL